METVHPDSARTETPQAIFLRLPAVMNLTGLARSTIYRFIADSSFPRPVRLGPRAVAWRRADVEHWSSTRVESSH